MGLWVYLCSMNWQVGEIVASCRIYRCNCRKRHREGRFAMALLEIEEQQQVGHQASQQLQQHPVGGSGAEMVDVQMLFLPSEKRPDRVAE